MKEESLCLYAGYTPGNGEPRVLPINQSTTFTYASTADVSKLFDLEAEGFFYTRLGNPTVDAVEKKIGEMSAVQRDNLSDIKRELKESLDKLGKDTRAELERVRADNTEQLDQVCVFSIQFDHNLKYIGLYKNQL